MLLSFDREIIEKAHGKPCPYCQGKDKGTLHRADYVRRVDGIDISGIADHDKNRRFSLCCSKDGCRKRHTVASARFIGRTTYSSTVVLLAMILHQGYSRRRYRQLHRLFGLNRKTIDRWVAKWRSEFIKTPFYRRMSGSFIPPPEILNIPRSILVRFEGKLLNKLLELAKYLSPISSPREKSMIF